MKWSITTLGIVIAAVALSACGSASARSAGEVAAQVPAVTKTVTRTPPPGIKWRASTVTGGGPPSVSCFPVGGRAYLTSPGAGVSAVNGCTISIKPVYPLSTGKAVITVTAPDGSTGSYIASWRG